MSRSSVIPFLAVALAGAACSSTAATYPGPPGSDASVTSNPDAPNNIVPSGKIKVQINSPDDNSVLTTNAAADVSASITIENGTDFVDPTTVVAVLTPKNATNVVSMGKLVGPVGSSEYRGQVSLAGLKSGDYTLVVRATTSGGDPGDAHVTITLDSGPQIVVVSPAAGGHYRGGVIVQVVADPGDLGPLMNLKGSLGGIPLDLQPSGQPNQYRAVVDFHQPTPPLTGEQLVIVSAENRNMTRTEVRIIFVVDEVGPVISATLPTDGTVVGGVIKISALVNDEAGVNDSSVQVIIGDNLTPVFRLALNREVGTSTFSVLFDTHNLTQCKPAPDTGLCIVFPTLSFRAADQLGNETVVAYGIAVDNIPPVADLVPPLIRDSKLDGVLLRCSFEFDPLSLNVFSGDAPDDLCRVPQVFDLRARVEDDGNRATGLKNPPISTVDPDRTAVYVQDDTTEPLVVDTDADGYCDAINPNLIPTTQPLSGGPREVLKVRLAPVPGVGAADFTPDPTVPPNVCAPGRDGSRPEIPCLSEQPTLAITYAGGLPAIWSVDPIEPKFHCFGGQFDTLENNVKNGGWKCIAVATADLNGARSVSAPIRVWVDYRYPDPQPFCLPPPSNAGPPPPCTGTFDVSSGMATSGPCRTRSFQPRPGTQEICYRGDCGICFSDDPSCAP